jgi:prepilin-type processing-associated H-X9-DG protein
MAVLFYYLLPFGPSGNKASKAQLCSTNMSLLAAALMQYSQDYDGRFPCGVIRNSSGAGWAGQVYPYAKTDAVLRCPGDVRTVGPIRSEVSYGYNSNVARSKSVTDLARPVSTVLLFEVENADGRVVSHGAAQWDEGAYLRSPSFSAAGNGLDGMLVTRKPGEPSDARYATGLLGGRPAVPERSQFDGHGPRHDGTAMYLFGDGHAGALTGNQVSSGTNAPSSTAKQAGGTHGTAAGGASGVTATFSID